MRSPRRTTPPPILTLALLAAGCVAEVGDLGDEKTTTAYERLNVGGYESSGCSTTVVRGLTEQLVAEANCIEPGAFRRIDDIPGVSLSSGAATAPYLQRDAAEALRRAVTSRSGASVAIHSGLRTLPQQYLLRQWYEAGRCGIRAAASPGRSNHESGLAVDVSSSQRSAWQSALEREGFAWAGSGDPVHFDYRGASSLAGLSVRAFQRLWNRNHPTDRIGEDGVYGSETAARLGRAPAEGFPVGATCAAPTPAPGGSSGGRGSELGCDRGSTCADCNAIAFNCGFCASTGACMAGDGDGPWEGACAGDWQWIRPSTCPDIEPEPEPDPDPDPPPAPGPVDTCAAHSSCAGCTAPGLGCGFCGDTGTCHSGSASGPDAGSCASWAWAGRECGAVTDPLSGGSLAEAHRGVTHEGHEVPRAGLYNPYLRGRTTEPHGELATHAGLRFVRGGISSFGGPRDPYTRDHTGAVTGERLVSLNDPDPASASTVASRPEDFYYLAMRWRYLPSSSDLGDVAADLRWWRAARLVVVNRNTGAAVVVRPVDWGPGPSEGPGRIVDVSPQALRDLGLPTSTSSNPHRDALVAFVHPSTPLGPLRGSGAAAPPAGDDPEPGPTCSEVQGSCATSAECCGDLSCRSGYSFSARCCVEAGGACGAGADCCGMMGCVEGACYCRLAGRSCLADRDCCSGDCSGGACR